jgi:hypothetical protein
LEGEAQGLRARIRTEGDSPGLQERLSNLEAGVEDRELRIADYEQRHEYLARWRRTWSIVKSR